MVKKIIESFFAIILVTSFPLSVFASQAMPRYGVNEVTKECAEFFIGDECTRCSLPADWSQIAGFSCPDGYKEVKEDSVCVPAKSEFCCTVQHSGGNGDCKNVVVNETEKKCAFVEDISKCRPLPKGWRQADDLTGRGSICPSADYVWLEDELSCLSAVDAIKTMEDASTSPNRNKAPNVEKSKNILSDNIQPIVALTSMSLVAVAVLVARFYCRKKNKKK